MINDIKKVRKIGRLFERRKATSGKAKRGSGERDAVLDGAAKPPTKSAKKTVSKSAAAAEVEPRAVQESDLQDGALETEDAEEPDTVAKSVLKPLSEIGGGYGSGASSFEQFVDERILVSHDAFGRKEMKIKVLEVSDEPSPARWKFGDRVKLNKILITIKHLETHEVEEGELDIEAVEKELAEKRHYTSTNRWVPINDIKNGYVVGSRHTALISDALALDYIVF